MSWRKRRLVLGVMIAVTAVMSAAGGISWCRGSDAKTPGMAMAIRVMSVHCRWGDGRVAGSSRWLDDCGGDTRGGRGLSLTRRRSDERVAGSSRRRELCEVADDRRSAVSQPESRRRHDNSGVGCDPLEGHGSSSSWELGDERSSKSWRRRWPRALVGETCDPCTKQR